MQKTNIDSVASAVLKDQLRCEQLLNEVHTLAGSIYELRQKFKTGMMNKSGCIVNSCR